MHRPLPALVGALLLASLLAGCTRPEPEAGAAASYREMGFDGETWPRLAGVTITILDHGAFGAFEEARSAFENRTGAHVVHVEADDTGSALNIAIAQKGTPAFDILYGIDNILWTRAIEAGIFAPYKPVLADRIAPEHVFFDAAGPWHATPVDRGYIALNVDGNHSALRGIVVEDLDDVRAHADAFVTEDPRTSTPGLGFLLATIAVYGEEGGYDWLDYWTDLFEGGALVTTGWTEAYEQHFSGGYGADYGGLADRGIVTSYTTSPAYEHFYGRSLEAMAGVVTAEKTVFEQIQTMGILAGTKNRAAAEAWIEFTLTDDFQKLAAPSNAIYPVVPGVDVADTYQALDPDPGALELVPFDAATIGAKVGAWVAAWVDLCEAHDCA